MDLRREVVEDPDGMPSLKQCIRSVRADKARATCYKNPFRFQIALSSCAKWSSICHKYLQLNGLLAAPIATVNHPSELWMNVTGGKMSCPRTYEGRIGSRPT